MMYYYDWYWGMGLMMFFTFLIFVVIIAALIYFYRKNKTVNSSDEVLDILKMKFVKGEISEEEYMKKKEILMK